MGKLIIQSVKQLPVYFPTDNLTIAQDVQDETWLVLQTKSAKQEADIIMLSALGSRHTPIIYICYCHFPFLSQLIMFVCRVQRQAGFPLRY